MSPVPLPPLGVTKGPVTSGGRVGIETVVGGVKVTSQGSTVGALGSAVVAKGSITKPLEFPGVTGGCVAFGLFNCSESWLSQSKINLPSTSIPSGILHSYDPSQDM